MKSKTLKSWADVPKFKNEADEADFWACHGMSAAMMKGLQVVSNEELHTAVQASAKRKPRASGKAA